MSRFIKLSMILFKNSLGGQNKKKKSSLLKNLAIIILLGVCFLPLIFSMLMLIWNGYDLFKSIGQQGVLIGLGLPIICFVTFFFGIFYVINTFYFAQDIEKLLPLPLQPWEILGAKFVVTTLYEYITVAIFLLPLLITYGIKSGAGLIYYMYSAIIFVAIPIVPLVIASLLVIVIMRFTNIKKYKERFKLFGGLLAIFIGLGGNVFFQSIFRNATSAEDLIKLLAQGNNSLLNIGNNIFPIARFATYAVVNSADILGFLNIVIYILLSVALFVLMMAIGEGMYFKGVIGVSETPSKRKDLSDKELTEKTRQNSAILSYSLKELRLLFRTPIYFINCILMNFLWPLFIMIPIFSQSKTIDKWNGYASIIKSEQNSGIAFVIIISIAIFLITSNGISASAISREGEGVYICKYIPMSYEEQIFAKIVPSIIMSGVGVFMLLIVVIIFYSPSITMLLLLCITAILAIIVFSFTGILLDLNFPKLHWDNEQKAVKQNYNVMINMFLSVAIAGTMIFIAFKFAPNLSTAFLVYGIILFTAAISLYKIIVTKGVQLFKNMEN